MVKIIYQYFKGLRKDIDIMMSGLVVVKQLNGGREGHLSILFSINQLTLSSGSFKWIIPEQYSTARL